MKPETIRLCFIVFDCLIGGFLVVAPFTFRFTTVGTLLSMIIGVAALERAYTLITEAPKS